MGVTKRAGRKKAGGVFSSGGGGGGGLNEPVHATFEGARKKEVGVSDLTLISKISNDAINENLKKRFEAAQIYTYIGPVLVSVNPFKDLGIYSPKVLDSYRGKNRLEASPHVFAIAEAAYSDMKNYQQNQCVIISGESGAGKTEAAKRIMQYIATVSGSSHSSIQAIKDKVLATNPLLESFGNAKTLRNNNSSRFGKYLELQFNEFGEPVGANITNYLLEKSRVVSQVVNERNFHIFYQFSKAASNDQRANFGVQQPQDYEYLRKSKCLDVPGIDDVADFKDTLQAMNTIELPQTEQDDIFRALAAILWIGNISFQEDASGNAEVRDTSVTDFIAYLLGVEAAHLVKAVTTRVVETSRGGRRGSVYDVPLNIVQATAVRDALSKAIYFNLFDQVVFRVNEKLKARGSVDYSIGILDIYGFEIFETNSFEQLCINYVNEKLQQIFIQLTLKAEQEEYREEQIQWTKIDYFDNKVVCDLIEAKRPMAGIFAQMNDSCATAHADSGAADQNLAQRLNNLSHNHFQPRQGQFVIKHYAGDVNYTLMGMTDKNKDQLLKDLLNLVGGSSLPFMHKLFPNQVNQDDKRRPPTAGDKIIRSADDLMVTLKKASPSYIRTIKPNENKSPSEYNTSNVLHQIKYLGLQENVRIRRAGFAYRQTFEMFVRRFFILSSKCRSGGALLPQFRDDPRAGTLNILADTKIPKEEYQMGVTKVFIKTPETIFSLEDQIERFWFKIAVTIQQTWRKSHGGDAFIEQRDRGHELLRNRKERRRFSLLGYRRFLGDYLGVNNRVGLGGVLAQVIDLPSKEDVLFSYRCSLLTTKFGRSSKPEPRILILTRNAIFIIVTAVANNLASPSIERSIPLGAIKYISTSTLKDDWFSIGVGSPQEPDPLLNCIFKTEFFTHVATVVPGGRLDLRVNESIEYNKKPGKPAIVKVVKDPTVQRDDFYKSGTIHTGPGEPPSSRSKQTPLNKSRQNGSARAAYRPAAASVQRSIPAAASRTPAAAPQALASAVNGSATKRSTGVNRVPPPPPPAASPAVVAPKKNIYRALYDFGGQSSTELSLKKDDLVEVVQKESNGWWLVLKSDGSPQGWAPAAYLAEEVVAAAPPPPAATPIGRAAPPPPPATNGTAKPTTAKSFQLPSHPSSSSGGAAAAAAAALTKAKPQPPAPPKRPGGASSAGKKAAPAPPPAAPGRSSATSSTTGGSSGISGRDTPNSSSPSLAGGLAEAIKARQMSMQGKEEEEDDW